MTGKINFYIVQVLLMYRYLYICMYSIKVLTSDQYVSVLLLNQSFSDFLRFFIRGLSVSCGLGVI